MGFRFGLGRRDLPGSPDIVVPKHRLGAFVHGCFWHSHARCGRARQPLTNVEYWMAKLRRNVERDTSPILSSGTRLENSHDLGCETHRGDDLKVQLEALLRSLLGDEDG